jgi:hypothetical protein
VGLRARSDDTVEVNPLAPESWNYFCLDQVRYHERWLTVLWDKTGTRYGRGRGLRVLADGIEIASAGSLRRVTGSFSPNPASEPRPKTTAVWEKYEGNPVMGGNTEPASTSR